MYCVNERQVDFVPSLSLFSKRKRNAGVWFVSRTLISQNGVFRVRYCPFIHPLLRLKAKEPPRDILHHRNEVYGLESDSGHTDMMYKTKKNHAHRSRDSSRTISSSRAPSFLVQASIQVSHISSCSTKVHGRVQSKTIITRVCGRDVRAGRKCGRRDM